MRSSGTIKDATACASLVTSLSKPNVCGFAPRPSFVSTVNKIARGSEPAKSFDSVEFHLCER